MLKGDLPTLRQIRETHGWKYEYERYLPLSRYIFRPIGFLLTWVFIRLGLTTEGASWISVMIGVAGCLSLTAGPERLLPIGIGLLFLFNLFDCIDGSIARATGTENPYGRFLDSVLGSVIDFAFFGVIGIMSYRHPHLLLWPNPGGHSVVTWLIVGEIAAFFKVLTGYMEYTYEDQILKVLIQKEGSKDASPKKNILRLIDRNLRVRETHYFLLAFAYIGKVVDVFLIAFAFYYTLRTVLVGAFYCARGKKIRHILKTMED